jgi:hypothetical protein
MQPTNPNQVRGSFGKPDSLVKSIAQHEMKKSEPQKDPEPTPEPKEQSKPADAATEQEKQKVLSEEERHQVGIDAFKKMCDEIYKLTITDDELKNYLFKGSLAKEMRVNKLMSGTFQSLRTEDLQEIDKKMSKIKEAGEFTSQGITNEEAVITLSYAWTHVDGKPLGLKPEERESKIRRMGGTFVSNAAEARINYETLIKILLNDIATIKK